MKERGLALLFLSEPNKIAALEIKNQFTLTNASKERFFAAAPHLRATLGRALSHDEDLTVTRQEVLSQFARPAAIASWYETNLINPLRRLSFSHVVRKRGTESAGIAAYQNLLVWLEALSRARDTGLTLIEPRWMMNPTSLEKIKNQLADVMAHEKIFFDLANDMQRQTFAGIKISSSMNAASCDEICAALAGDRFLPSLSTMGLVDWFSVFSSKIEVLQNLAHALALTPASGPVGNFFVTDNLDADVEAALSNIRAWPILKGLSPLAVNGLLRGARVINANKNESILTQGEPVNRFYVILDGWVKIFKSSADGEETILHIAGRKEALLDVNVQNDAPAPSSVKALGRVRILAISYTALRETMAQHKDFCTNILAAAMHRLQRISALFEQVTLRSAEHRVGWFLLNLYRETGLEGAPITLPYDKSLIAAYLNLKPETFSRVLADFKKRGFKIDKNQVVMPTPRALCAYCDHEIAHRCGNAATEECPRIELRRDETSFSLRTTA